VFEPASEKFTDSHRHPACYPAECMGKTPYPSKAAAIKRIRCQARLRGFKRKGPTKAMVSYRCPHCKLWHVGGTGRSD
jgi:hypothetical protein